MTTTPSTTDFLVRLRKIDRHDLKARDILILWAICHQPGMMGNEIAFKLGYNSRSNVQGCIARLIRNAYVDDRRLVANQMTPNDLHITQAGRQLLDDIVPA